jgi:hypothetical protein
MFRLVLSFAIHSVFPILLVTSCNSLSPREVTSEPNELPIYETVNSVPQFADDETHFLLYWSVWRHLSKQERQTLGDKPGVLLSERDISWTMVDCNTHENIHSNGEKVWYRDEIDYDAEGKVKPIKEATRKDYRYLNMINLNSQHLRGAGPYIAPKKIQGETLEEWDVRRHKAYLDWEKRSWAKGTRGQVLLKAEHRLYAKQQISEDSGWINPQDYPKATGELLDWITRLSPKRWPIYYDERAHKPHQFKEPKIWLGNNKAISRHQFRMRFTWNWCDTTKPVQVELFFPKGEIPPPGPNRPGRTDSGEKTIKINEVEWPETNLAPSR